MWAQVESGEVCQSSSFVRKRVKVAKVFGGKILFGSTVNNKQINV